ncbi:MAG TPA: hypothetical protein PKE40_04820 [Arachnia sp.]|nr:hypothetical protein [Arachnia sp.]HMT85655.1 hypothetical protein [Arachnia sp.]
MPPSDATVPPRPVDLFSPQRLLLRAGGTAVFLRCDEDALPEVLYWGADLGPLTPDALDAWASAGAGVVSGCADIAPRLSLLPSQAEGWLGTPGLIGSRGGLGQFSAFAPPRQRCSPTTAPTGRPAACGSPHTTTRPALTW